jgi:hypothetical protein
MIRNNYSTKSNKIIIIMHQSNASIHSSIHALIAPQSKSNYTCGSMRSGGSVRDLRSSRASAAAPPSAITARNAPTQYQPTPIDRSVDKCEHVQRVRNRINFARNK